MSIGGLMEWIARPANAHPSWPTNELWLRWARIVVSLRTTDGLVAGTVQAVSAGTIKLNTPHGLRAIDVRSITAYAISAGL